MDTTWLIITGTGCAAVASFVVSIRSGIGRSRARREVDALLAARPGGVEGPTTAHGSRIRVVNMTAMPSGVQQSAALADPSIAESYLRNLLANRRVDGMDDAAK